MDFFTAFVILLNAGALIAAGYLLWNLGEIFDRKLTDAIRKQDDRLRKRSGSAVNGKATESEGTASETSEADGGTKSTPRRQAGRPYR